MEVRGSLLARGSGVRGQRRVAQGAAHAVLGHGQAKVVGSGDMVGVAVEAKGGVSEGLHALESGRGRGCAHGERGCELGGERRREEEEEEEEVVVVVVVVGGGGEISRGRARERKETTD